MKSFLAYCIFVLQVSEVVDPEQVNTPVDPDGEVQLFNEQTSTTQIEKFFILRRFTRIMKQFKNAPQILSRNKCLAPKKVFQELAIMQEKKMSDD